MPGHVHPDRRPECRQPDPRPPVPHRRTPGRLSAILPSVPPGRAKPDTFHVGDLQQRTDSYTRNTPRDRFDRLTDRRLTGTGMAGLLAGYLHSRPPAWNLLSWFDVADDGRYVRRRSREHVEIRPATTDDLTRHFTTWIDLALKRLHADDPDTW